MIHLSGYAGLLVIIDDMEILMNRSSGDARRYTRLRRDDTYESIRQLIDDIDNMRYIMFFFCFDRELIDNENYGIKSYQALWMRIQNEVVSPRFNHFADIIDLDRYGDEFYTEDVLLEMAEKMAEAFEAKGYKVGRLDKEDIRSLYERARFGGIGLPYLVNRALLEKGEKENHD